jgi:hypothetical protein
MSEKCEDIMGSGTGEHDFSTEAAGRFFCYNCRKSFTAEEIDAMFHEHYCPFCEETYDCGEQECAPPANDVTTNKTCYRCEASDDASQISETGYF